MTEEVVGVAREETLPGIQDEVPDWKDVVSELKTACVRRGSLSADLVVEDRELLRLFLIWPLVPIWRNEEKVSIRSNARVMTKDAYLHQASWTGTRVDWKKLGELLGKRSSKEVQNLVKKAKSLCIIWPDGTVNELLLGYLTSRLGSAMIRNMAREV